MDQNRFQYLSLSNGNKYFVSVHGGEFIDHVRAYQFLMGSAQFSEAYIFEEYNYV